MTKQPEDWLDDVPGDDVEDEDDEIIWVSKSEIKRDAEELKRLGAELVDLGKTRWIKFRWIPTCATPSNSPSESKRGSPPPAAAYRQDAAQPRCRSDSSGAGQAENRHNQQVALFHKLEQIRDRLIDDGMTPSLKC